MTQKANSRTPSAQVTWSQSFSAVNKVLPYVNLSAYADGN